MYISYHLSSYIKLSYIWCLCQPGENRASSRAPFWNWVGGVGCVNVHVNLRHMHMLRHVLGWGDGVC